LPDELKSQVTALGFGGIFKMKADCMDLKLLSRLMLMLNPDNMKLEVGGDQSIDVNEHSVWCMFMLPKVGCDPPVMSDADARSKLDELGQQICPDSYAVSGITVANVAARLTHKDEEKRLTGNLALRAFFMVLFQSLLFCNTDSKARLQDVAYTKDLENIGKINWCKAVVDNLCKSARLYRKEYSKKGYDSPLNGCGIFLTVSVSE
jgi:hypothetical protein